MRLPDELRRRVAEGGERFAVTGASGWLGLATLDLLADAMGAEELSRRVSAYASEPKAVRLRDGTVVEASALAALPAADPAPDHVLHYAYLTKDRADALGHDAFLRGNLLITLTVIEALRRWRPAGLFMPSSGAVYGPAGELTTDLAGNPYGALKHLDELAFRQACRDGGTALVLARVFNVAGPYMTKPQLYALGDLIRQAQDGEPLRVRARGPVRRSFVSVADVIGLALAALLAPEPEPEVVFDTAGDEVVEMGELAERVRAALGRPDLEIERDWDPSAAPSDYVGDGGQMRALADRLGVPLTSLDDMIRATAEHAAETRGVSA